MSNPKYLFFGKSWRTPKAVKLFRPQVAAKAGPQNTKIGILANGNLSGPETHETTTQVGPSNYPDSQGLGEPRQNTFRVRVKGILAACPTRFIFCAAEDSPHSGGMECTEGPARGKMMVFGGIQ